MYSENILKDIREERKWSQKKLAKEMGVSQQAISTWETGERVPKPKDMQHIEDIFLVNKEKIFFAAFRYET